jgi:hypothetical protein
MMPTTTFLGIDFTKVQKLATDTIPWQPIIDVSQFLIGGACLVWCYFGGAENVTLMTIGMAVSMFMSGYETDKIRMLRAEQACAAMILIAMPLVYDSADPILYTNGPFVIVILIICNMLLNAHEAVIATLTALARKKATP